MKLNLKYLIVYIFGTFLIMNSCIEVENKSKKNRLSNKYDKKNGIANIIDTLINVGNHHLHFKIFKGKGIPILFENGAGDDCSVWDKILKPIAKKTGATLITYDRAGFGKSTIDTSEADISKHGILSGLLDLEIALQKLGYNKSIMLVSHSYGGYYTTLYSSKHPSLVKSIVLIDVNHNFYETSAKEEMENHKRETLNWKKKNISFYYMASNLANTAKIMSKISIPKNIPVVDFIDGISFQENKQKTQLWIECHKKFISEHPKSIGITAHGCGHYIWFDNPNLVIKMIIKYYNEIKKTNTKKALV